MGSRTIWNFGLRREPFFLRHGCMVSKLLWSLIARNIAPGISPLAASSPGEAHENA